jgi:hypothetical protein
VIVEITQDDIDNSHRFKADKTCLALALKRELKRNDILVSDAGIMIGLEAPYQYVAVDKKMKQYFADPYPAQIRLPL